AAPDSCAHLIHDAKVWRGGRTVETGFAEDYAALAAGFLEHYQTTGEESYFAEAAALCRTLLKDFRRPEGGFFDTGERHEQLVARAHTLHDVPTPSASALAFSVMLRLHALDGSPRWFEAVERALPAMLPPAAQHPATFAQWLLDGEDWLGGVKSVALVGKAGDPVLDSLRSEVARTSWPEVVLAWGCPGEPTGVPVLSERVRIEAPARAYVCVDMVCRLPAESIEELRTQLAP
ncbi:MAG: N-acylglucosamine 2-epimerase, partial [Chloroflexi bacterium]|nr:N-acylglucosamine 2-epimerase [Chloroflexota bacterium]